jgi:hypothetical protein
MPLGVAGLARVWKARGVPEEPVTLDELERLVQRLAARHRRGDDHPGRAWSGLPAVHRRAPGWAAGGLRRDLGLQ